MNKFLPFITQLLNGNLQSFGYFYPELALVFLFLLVILADLFVSKKLPQATFWLTLTGLVVTAMFSVQQFNLPPKENLFNGMVGLSRLIVIFKLLFSLTGMLFVFFIRFNRQLQNHRKGVGDLYPILIGVILGMNLMDMSSNLLMVYLSIEMVSVGSYLMVGYVSANNKQAEAAMKYALFGAVCSALMLYGMSLLYGFTGTLNLNAPTFIGGLQKIPNFSLAVAITMVLIGIGFKLSFVPLHFWSPDVYEGAPTPVTAFLSTGTKIAGFAILLRVLKAFSPYGHGFVLYDFHYVLGGISIITMIVGNFSALWQSNVKRMLAYSSIGHTGFILMALLGFTEGGIKSLLFYLLVYALMNIAAFMLADYIEEKTGATTVEEYKGLGKRMPLAFVTFTVLLVSLTGLPPTAGFIAKLFVFSAALDIYNFSGSILVLVVIITGAITTLISLFYYFKVPLNAFLRNTDTESNVVYRPNALVYISVAIAIFLLLTGIYPQLINAFLSGN